MNKFFSQLTAFIIFPSLIFTAAVLPFKCSLTKDGGIFKSTDFGTKWEQKVKIDDKQTIGDKNVLSLAIDSFNPTVLYLGTQGSGLFLSKDEAQTWQQLSSDVLDKGADIYDIEIDPKNPDFVYLAVFQGGFGRVLRSQNNVQSWQEIYVVSKEKVMVTAIEIDNFNNAIIYLGTSDGGIFKSLDGGNSWQLLKWFGDSISDIKIDPRADQIVYAATLSQGIYKTSDQGQNWQALSSFQKTSSGLGSVNPLQKSSARGKIKNIIIDPRDSRILHVACENEISVSFDAGETWQKLNILLPEQSSSISVAAQDPKNSSVIYYGAGTMVYKTTNSGQTWTVQQISSARTVRVIKIDPLDSNIVYVGMHE